MIDPSLELIQWPPFLLASKVQSYQRFSLLHLFSDSLSLVDNLLFSDPNCIRYGSSIPIQGLWPLEAYMCGWVYEMCCYWMLWVPKARTKCVGSWRDWEKVFGCSSSEVAFWQLPNNRAVKCQSSVHFLHPPTPKKIRTNIFSFQRYIFLFISRLISTFSGLH